MNIREIERQLGIPRANIRYYEEEGLLHPARGSNNYRTYSEKDVETLRKIRLLRRLDMPIETIRAVQAGEVPLAEAVARQERLLENEAAKLDVAREGCRSMLADQVTYAALEPARYDEACPALYGRQTEPETPKKPPVEGAEWANRPWQRFWARSLDLALASGAVAVTLSLAFHVSALTMNSRALQLLVLLLEWALVFAAEPLLLSVWGTTPGKWLLGLELRDSEGRKLSRREALERLWGVLWKGYGCEIPFYGLYRFYKSYQACSSGEGMPYDRERDFQYYSLVPGRWYGRAAVSVALAALISLGSTWCGYQVLLPPNRGAITKAELAENISALAKRLDYALWVDEDGYELAQQTMSWREEGGPWVEQVYGEPISDEPVYTVETDENGYVTAVIRTEEGGFNGEERSFTWLNTWKIELAVMAFAGTSGSGWQLSRSPLLRELTRYDVWEDGAAVNAGGFALTAALEQEGYDAGAGVLVSREGAESGWYRFTVRLEKAA